MSNTRIEVNLGFQPEAAVSGAALVQSEYSAVLMFNTTNGRAVVSLEACSVTKFGYPNDEALAGHPLYHRGLSGYGVFEVLNSEWIDLTVRQNQVSFPATRRGSGRHFIFTFHDSTFECIAGGLNASLETETPTRSRPTSSAASSLTQPCHHLRAFANMRCQPEYSPAPSGRQEFCA